MARVENIFCEQCTRPRAVTINAGSPTPSICATCQTSNRLKKRKMHLKSLEALTVEERIRQLEEWVYDYRPPKEMRF